MFPGGKAFDYQQAWATDESQYKLGVKARQIGITTTEAIKQFVKSLFWEESEKMPSPPVTVFVSPSDRQSKRLMQYVQRARSKFERLFDGRIKFKKEKEDYLMFENGAEVWSLPCNPRTIEGIDTNLCIVDELGNFEGNDDRAVYEAMMGSLGAKGGGMVLFGKPRGRRGLFWELFDPHGEFREQFSVYEFPYTVRAKSDKRYRDTVEEQRLRMGKLAFKEQYECAFVDEGVVIFPYSIIDKQTKNLRQWRLGQSINKQFPLYIGIDFARVKDQTAVTIVEHTDKGTNVRFHDVTKEKFDKQIDWISHIIDWANPVKCLVDKTGLGLPMLDILEAKYSGRVEGVQFTQATKEKMILNTRNLLDDGLLWLPQNKELIDQIHGMEKEVLESGRIKYTGKRTETDWLDDRAWSLFLACSQLGEHDFDITIIDRNKRPTITDIDRWAMDLDEYGNPL